MGELAIKRSFGVKAVRGRLKGGVAAGILIAFAFLVPGGASGQSLQHVQADEAPLVLKSRGSFMVGGERVEQSAEQLGSPYAAAQKPGHVTINQMFVEFMVPDRSVAQPVIMIHGGTLTGKTYDTTPDGRTGWYEYFVRRGRPTYVADQVGRGRSGFNLALYNEVRAGKRPASDLPNAFRLSDETDWTNFRIGPSVGAQFPGQQFPVEAMGELSKQSVPDMIGTLHSPDLTPKALASLAGDLGGAVIVSHSQSGPWPLEASLLAPSAVRAAVLVEPGRCPATYTDAQVQVFAGRPILMIFGDNLDANTGLPTTWRGRFDACQALIGRINAAGGKARMLYLPDAGMIGNTHMIMQDRNSHKVADKILQWLDSSLGKAKPAKKR